MKLLKYIAGLFAILITLSVILPWTVPMTDNIDFSDNYRIPYRLGEDYFLYQKYVEQIKKDDSVLFLGDSVIWGHYVDNNNTIPAILNRSLGGDKFYNCGIDGIHPVALQGLISHYGSSIKNKKVIVGINLLWMSSPRHDLTGKQNDEINHKSLLSQFSEEIPAYSATVEEKVSRIMSRAIPLFGWINHVKHNRFADESFYRWTIKHPGALPADFFSMRKNEKYVVPETLQGNSVKQNIKWISLDNSYQWKKIKEILKDLKSRKNRVMALITPYNRESMTAESLKTYTNNVNKIKDYLKEKSIPFSAPEITESSLFSDASHTSRKGYERVVEKLLKDKSFTDFISR